MNVKLSRQSVITALGLRFWIKAVEDRGIAEDVSRCVTLSQHLQSAMSNNHQVEQLQKMESDSVFHYDDTFLVILIHGVHSLIMRLNLALQLECPRYDVVYFGVLGVYLLLEALGHVGD